VWAWPQFAGAVLFRAGGHRLPATASGCSLSAPGDARAIDPPKKFVRRGLYKWVRNPMYHAVFALVGAEALFLMSWHIAVYLILLACLIHTWVLLYEERSSAGASAPCMRTTVEMCLDVA